MNYTISNCLTKVKNKAKQTQFKPNNQSSLITNHLEGKPNFKMLVGLTIICVTAILDFLSFYVGKC